MGAASLSAVGLACALWCSAAALVTHQVPLAPLCLVVTTTNVPSHCQVCVYMGAGEVGKAALGLSAHKGAPLWCSLGEFSQSQAKILSVRQTAWGV